MSRGRKQTVVAISGDILVSAEELARIGRYESVQDAARWAIGAQHFLEVHRADGFAVVLLRGEERIEVTGLMNRTDYEAAIVAESVE